MTPDRLLDHVSASSNGLITREQALTAGLDDSAIAHRLRTGAWAAEFTGVYRITAVPPSWEQRLAAACLAAGPDAVASHRSAAILWGIDGFGGRLLEVTVPYRRCPEIPGVTIHRSTDVSNGWTTRHRGVPVTTPLRTLVDLGAVVRPWLVERAFTDVHGRKLMTLASAQGALAALARRGRRGISAFRECVERRSDSADPAGWLESQLWPILQDADIPDAVPEFEVWHEGERLGRLDYAVPALRLGAEANGYEHHASYDGFENDHLRRRRLQRAGWEIVEFTRTEIRRNPEGVAADMEAAYRRRLAIWRSGALALPADSLKTFAG